MSPQPCPQGEHVIGYTDVERTLLLGQAALLAAPTREVFVRAGLCPGMRVLDLGCGIGEVTLLVASLVGSGGIVIGIDRDLRAVRCARERIGALPAHFEVCDLTPLSDVEAFGAPFDAVVGRSVLCHQRDPASVLRKIASVLRPGGLVVFIEPEVDLGLHANVEFPETTRYTRLVHETLRQAGVYTNCGTQLPKIFHAAGLPWPETATHIVMGSGPDFAGYDHWANTLAVLLPLVERLGTAAVNELKLGGVADRIRQEVVGNRSSLVTHLVVGAWARRIGAHPDMIAFR